jgi:hypothetical protein
MPTRDDYVADTWRTYILRLRGVRPLTRAFLVRDGERGGYTTSEAFVVTARFGSIFVDSNCAFDLRDESYLVVFRAVDPKPVEYKVQWTDILDIVC